MKNNKYISIAFFTFIAAFIIFFFLSFSILNCIQNFVLINFDIIKVSFYISLSLSIVAVIWNVWNNYTGIVFEIHLWIDYNYHKLFVSFLLIIWLLNSIKKEIFWTNEEIYKVISIEWTIFSLSIAIFLVWIIVVINYFRTNNEIEDEKLDSFQKCLLLINKRSKFREIKTSFSTIIFLSINLFLLLFSTSLIYVSKAQEKLLTQNTVLFTFYFTTNSIALLFIDILKPLKISKSELLKSNLVSKDELNIAMKEAVMQIINEGKSKKIEKE